MFVFVWFDIFLGAAASKAEVQNTRLVGLWYIPGEAEMPFSYFKWMFCRWKRLFCFYFSLSSLSFFL